MKAVHEKYIDTPENFNTVHAFLRKMVTLTGKLQTWEFVRFEFWNQYEAPKSADPNFMEHNAHLWKNEAGEITGLFISESGGGFFSLIVHPDYPYLADEMVAWTRNVWGKEKKKLNTDCYPYGLEVKALLDQGFVQDSHIGNTRRYDLLHTEYTCLDLEEGFSIRSMAEIADEESKGELIEQIFSPSDSGPVKVEYWRKTLPSYLAELDFSVVDDKGRHIAFCFGFVDQDNGIAVIETIGTHPDYRQRGFGKAVVTACFLRLKEQGVKTAYITGFSAEANALYQSLQPVEIIPVNSYVYEF
ncbi:GNAT family N-acetyltransferase [Paenibacillus piscarius]|uniref:GNAT family N-acetyltransferase n=1 Tax=Paenibacillus piscarius TaxID=1089681 RepID=UPI001EE881ED|nr:GNAT family N-acetyltransferase [Paenibacillus piscarius]